MLSHLTRPLFTTLLAGLFLLGNAPAWLHYGSCNERACRVSVATAKPACGPKHCCRCVVASKPAGPQLTQAGDETTHDSESCSACQIAVTGVSATAQVAAVTLVSANFISYLVAYDRSPLIAIVDERIRPRGPPSVIG